MMEKTSVPYDTMSVNSVSSEPMYSKCCCCIPLRIGCFILGYLNLFINCVRTLFFLGVTLFFGVMTHGFDHVDPPEVYADHDQSGMKMAMMKGLDNETVHMLGWVLPLMTIFELIWLSLNIVCLVGIHTKRPGHIRTYVGFATFRLLLAITGYMYQFNTFHGGVLGHCIEIGLSAYFILVYYIYAMRLEKEAQAAQLPQVPQLNNISYIYPSKLDKEHLVV